MGNRLKKLLLENVGTRQIIVKNVFWLSFSQIASRLIRAAIIIFAARVLGAAGYGVFSYALGLAGFFTIFADLGVSGIMTREVAQKPEQAQKYFSTSFWIKFVLATSAAIAVFIAAPYFSKIEAAKAIFPLVAILIFFDNIRDFCTAFFRGKEKMEIEAFVTILTNLAVTAFGFGVLYLFRTSFALAVSYVVSAGVGMCAAILILRKEFLQSIKNFERRLAIPILSNSWPFALLGILGAFMLNVDLVMLGWMRSAAEIGLYSAGQKIVQVLYTLPAIVASSTFPTLSRLKGQNEQKGMASIIEKTTIATLLIAIPVMIGGILLAKPLMIFVYGIEYSGASPAFQILIASIIFAFPNTLLSNFVFIHNKQKKMARYMAFAAFSNVALNALLIPSLGIVGAALATLSVQIIYSTMTLRLAKTLSDFTVFRPLKNILIAAVSMGIFSFLIDLAGVHVLVNIVLSGFLYFAALFWLKENITSELMVIFRTAVQPHKPLP